MKEQVQNTIEEIALLAVMLHEADEAGFDLVFEHLESIIESAGAEPSLEPLQTAAKELVASRGSLENAELLQNLNTFISSAQDFLRDPEGATFSGAADNAPSGWGEDLSPSADFELMEEFIAKHRLMLDEFESELLQAANAHQGEAGDQETEEQQELTRYVKGYLHNIKGDAGTVGLTGISQATHYLEDLVVERSALQMMEHLFQYREWVLDCMEACQAGEPPKVLSEEYLAVLKRNIDGAESPNEQKEALDNNDEETSVTPQKKKNEESYPISGDLEVLGEFISEAEDHLNAVEEVLLENGGDCDSDAIDSLFRAIHSIKGGSSYFGLLEITDTSHKTESLLDRVREGELPFNRSLADLLLLYIDLQKKFFQKARKAMENDGALVRSPRTEKYFAKLDACIAGLEGKEVAPPEKQMEEQDVSPVDTQSGEALPDEPQAEAASPVAPNPEKTTTNQRREKLNVKTFLKVEAERLDQLIDYIGELVISSSMLLRDCRTHMASNESVMKNSHQLEQILREVQYIGMSMRLVPLKGVFQKMARLVWDTSKKIEKQISFQMEGEDTELDRTVIEKIADPLMHMVRNAVDHGIETPEERLAAGKPAEGTITLSAYHQGGSVHIKIEDDGKGLDPEKLRAKAIEKGIIREEDKLSKSEILHLIFAAGFSTAKVVTDISGRGVGMDVVRRNIESMRGRVFIDSEIGKGSTFTIELPLTLAIIDGIETRIGTERFIIPTLSIIEFLRPSRDMLSYPLDKGETLAFREQFLPVFRIGELYNIHQEDTDPTESIVVVVEVAGEHVALMVDEVVGKYSTVIKSLGSMFADARGLAGCAIMPDGYVGLILDVPGLVQYARSAGGARSRKALPSAETREAVVAGAIEQ